MVVDLSTLSAQEFIRATTEAPIVYPTEDEFREVWARSTPDERDELARAFPVPARRLGRVTVL